ncbi:MAG: hypothetical protein HY901_06550 [Deltaproteobacteria bacterium]|nr:hypothetical protein [Deltaproteobacteria bacterium]
MAWHTIASTSITERVASFGALVAAARRAACGHQRTRDVADFLLALEPPGLCAGGCFRYMDDVLVFEAKRALWGIRRPAEELVRMCLDDRDQGEGDH